MTRPLPFADISPIDELLDRYFPEDDCHSDNIQESPLEELVSDSVHGDIESFLSPPDLSIHLDTNSNAPHSPQSVQDSSEHITDDALVSLPMKDLNQRLRRVSKAEAQRMRKRRRSLKNRAYATSCRQRRAALKESLQTQNNRLKAQLRETKEILSNTVKDRDSYKNKYETLHKVYTSAISETVVLNGY